MRTLVSLLSLCALLAGQAPFTPCPVALHDDERAAAHEVPQPHPPHHAAAEPTRHDGAGLRLPVPHRDSGSCTMLTRCDWVAVPTQPVGCDVVRSHACADVAVPPRIAATAEPLAPTPPPKAIS